MDRPTKDLCRQQSASVLKQGFLIRKAGLRHTWKTHWCILKEKKLMYYHTTRLTHAAGGLSLFGASVISPVPDYTKRPNVFKLCTANGKEHLLQAPTDEERTQWAHTLSAVIRALVTENVKAVEKTNNFIEVKIKYDLSEILSAMQDADAGVQMTATEIDKIEYTNCFTGDCAVMWLLQWMFAKTREEASQLAGHLLSLGHIQPLGSAAKKKSEVVPHLNQFRDYKDMFYRFTSLHRSNSDEMLADSGSDMSSSSEAEQSEDDILDSVSPQPGKGKIVKEGFLLKKGHDLRKKWKVRRVVLRSSPLSLEYYSASKTCKVPLKLVSLEGGSLIEQPDINRGHENCIKRSSSGKRQRYLVCIQRPEGRPVLIAAQDEHQHAEWTRCLASTLSASPP